MLFLPSRLKRIVLPPKSRRNASHPPTCCRGLGYKRVIKVPGRRQVRSRYIERYRTTTMITRKMISPSRTHDPPLLPITSFNPPCETPHELSTSTEYLREGAGASKIQRQRTSTYFAVKKGEKVEIFHSSKRRHSSIQFCLRGNPSSLAM